MSEDDTGLATLSVTRPTLADDTVIKLANELAKAQREPEDVLESFSISVAQFTTYVEHNPFFKQVYAAAVQDWNSATSAAKRIKIKSAASLESSLTTLHQRLNDPQSALPAVVDTAKLLATLAGVGDTKQAPAGSGERFSININIGSKKIESAVEPTIDITPQPALEKPGE
jgi:hypothetical protein